MCGTDLRDANPESRRRPPPRVKRCLPEPQAGFKLGFNTFTFQKLTQINPTQMILLLGGLYEI